MRFESGVRKRAHCQLGAKLATALSLQTLDAAPAAHETNSIKPIQSNQFNSFYMVLISRCHCQRGIFQPPALLHKLLLPLLGRPSLLRQFYVPLHLRLAIAVWVGLGGVGLGLAGDWIEPDWLRAVRAGGVGTVRGASGMGGGQGARSGYDDVRTHGDHVQSMPASWSAPSPSSPSSALFPASPHRPHSCACRSAGGSAPPLNRLLWPLGSGVAGHSGYSVYSCHNWVVDDGIGGPGGVLAGWRFEKMVALDSRC